jgi:hypothetical protein
MTEEADNDDDRAFTPAERKRLRLMIERESRIEWVWATVRIWLGWISASIIAGFAIWQAFSSWFQGVSRKVGGP